MLYIELLKEDFELIFGTNSSVFIVPTYAPSLRVTLTKTP